MNITEIKAAISAKENFVLGSMPLYKQYNEAPDPTDATKVIQTETEWVSYWNNDYRIRVTMHQDILTILADNPTKADLAFKRTEVAAHGKTASYVRYVIITPKDAVAVL